MRKNIGILKADGCTESEAKKYLENGTVIFEESDLRDNFSYYMQEWDIDEEEREEYKTMLDSKKPLRDWGVVEYQGTVCFIQYVL